MRIIECVQGTEEWYLARRGIPTASRFSEILTPKTMKVSKSSDGLIADLIGERFATHYPENVESFTNKAIRWGQQTEAEARRWYALEKGVEVRQVGFMLTDDGRFGASPDGLVGEDGGLELKCPQHKKHTETLLGEGLPDDYKIQVHGNLIVSGREWWDLASYCPGLPPFVCRVYPDDFTQKLKDALEEFYANFMKALQRIAPDA